MSEWKAGDRAMVEIAEIVGSFAMLRNRRGGKDSLLLEILQPLPTDPHQALKDAVIAAAGEVRITHPLTDERLRAIIKMFYAIDALTAAQTPPKPDLIEVFYEVAGDNLCVCSSKTWKLCRSKPDECACRHYITEGLAAVEAARGAK